MPRLPVALVLAAVLAACGPSSGGARGEPPPGASPLRSPARSTSDPPPAGTTAEEAEFLTPIEREVALALTALRGDPPGYAATLIAHRARFRGDLVSAPGEDVPIRTVEGVAAVDEAIAAVKATAPVDELVISPALSRIARAHASEIGRAGTLDHHSRDGRAPHQRMGEAGMVEGQSGENIGTGYADGAMMLLSLVVDDGVPGRGHRKNLLEREFRVVGIGCAGHRAYRTVCVLDLAAGFRER